MLNVGPLIPTYTLIISHNSGNFVRTAVLSKLPVVHLFNKILSNKYKLYYPVVHYVRSRRILTILRKKKEGYLIWSQLA